MRDNPTAAAAQCRTVEGEERVALQRALAEGGEARRAALQVVADVEAFGQKQAPRLVAVDLPPVVTGAAPVALEKTDVMTALNPAERDEYAPAGAVSFAEFIEKVGKGQDEPEPVPVRQWAPITPEEQEQRRRDQVARLRAGVGSET